MDDLSLIHYIISDINDTPHNKSPYTALLILLNLKKKCVSLNKFNNTLVDLHRGRNIQKRSPLKCLSPPSANKSPRCVLRNTNSHKANPCPTIYLSLKCFRCNFFGHKSEFCAQNTRNKQTTQAPFSSNTANRRYNQMHAVDLHPLHHMHKMANSIFCIYSLIYTDSHATFLCENICRLLESPTASFRSHCN